MYGIFDLFVDIVSLAIIPKIMTPSSLLALAFIHC